MTRLIRVLVVDDSAFVRKIVTQMLSRSPFIEVVGSARDGGEALEMCERLRPDVVTLDLVMPGIDGLEFLRRQMATHPIPVVVCSISHESGAAALEAFELGAVEFVQKPTALATDRVFEIAEELLAKVKAAAAVNMPARGPDETTAPVAAPRAKAGAAPPVVAGQTDIVVIGISTGGPQALRHVIPRFAADFPVPIAVVLHMPVGYTEMYAQRLNDISGLDVVEAHDGDLIRPGAMFLAPAGRHLAFARAGDGAVHAHLDLRPFDTPHRPAVDVLFRSAAEVYGSRVLGVVMTGMGTDGLVGAAHIKAKGGRILTEAESSCVVYGMPRAVVEACLSDRVATLNDMASSIMEMV
ncbi:MAG: Chemotaxis response regulator protein-glutamate methylesterase [Gemmatimonadetes bacterium]|nr:Chemotaxis response regulator protein-glutamate methylesterase [Gemmatimonadota bacterium]